tara:strand:- start:727 stop:1659 length:933 start_codon:yes stop_codon:yes gene_type:complete
MPTSNKFSRFAWGVLIYNLAVILWGAWVRITGSGAGCGDHWPTCGGEVIPRSPSTETLIEFSHRLTSGVTLILAIILVVFAMKHFRPGHASRRASVITLLFILLEAALGALLVIKGLVAKDTSIARAIVTSLHLANTLGLVAFGALTAWHARPHNPSWGSAPSARWTQLVILGLIAVGMTGAITALGDTLFPVPIAADTSLWAQISSDLTATDHFLIRLRIVHPIVSVIVATITLMWANAIKTKARAGVISQLSALVIAVVLIQVLVGVFNIMLHAPGWIQLCHLLIANILWISVVLTASEASHMKPVTH